MLGEFGFFAVAAIVVAAIYYYFTSTFDFWEDRGVPFKKPTIFLGNFGPLLLFQKSQAEGIAEMYNWFKNERFFGVFRVRSPILILRDPELIKNVCIRDFASFPNRAIPINTSKDPLTGHLFNLEGRQWRNLRSKLTPAFSLGKVKKMFYLLEECAEELQSSMDRLVKGDGIVVEVRDLAANFTIDVIGSCSFGVQINALVDEESAFKKAARKISRPSYKATIWRMLRSALPRIYRLFGVQVIDPEVTKFFQNVVSQMIRQREKCPVKRHDFMDLLIELKNKGFLENERPGKLGNEGNQSAENIELDETSIAAQVFAFFVAGFETSSNTIAFCLYELGLNPEMQQITRRNILDSIEKHGKLTYEAVREMKYLDMVVSETLRKYPPAPLLSRKCENFYRIPDSKVELAPGMRVVIPIYGIHHDSDYYREPEAFKPERFTEENKRARQHNTYIPFGLGFRNCIGTKFALLQMKVAIISFLRRHKVETCEKSTLPMKFSKRSIVTASENGVWLKISPV